MEFTDSEIDRLYSAVDNSERLSIVGYNGFGEPFEVEGYIGLVNSSEMPELSEEDGFFAGIFENGLILDVGKISQFPTKCYRTPYSMLLFTDCKDLDLPTQPLLFIQSIKSMEKKDTVYCNFEFDNLLSSFKYAGQRFDKEVLKRGSVPATLDDQGATLKKFIGTPMNLGGKQGILTSVSEVLPNGDLCLFGLSGPNLFTAYLKSKDMVCAKNGILCEVSKQEIENKHSQEMQ